MLDGRGWVIPEEAARQLLLTPIPRMRGRQGSGGVAAAQPGAAMLPVLRGSPGEGRGSIGARLRVDQSTLAGAGCRLCPLGAGVSLAAVSEQREGEVQDAAWSGVFAV